MNFKTGDITDEQMKYYENWFADFELTVNKDVTLMLLSTSGIFLKISGRRSRLTSRHRQSILSLQHGQIGRFIPSDWYSGDLPMMKYSK